MAVVYSAKASKGYEVKTVDILRKDLSEDATSIQDAISDEGKRFLRKLHWPVLVDFSGHNRKLKLANLNGMGVMKVNAVKELDLSHNSLTTTLGLEIFKEVQMLLASHNRFKSVALMNFKLEVLDLSNNELARFPDISALERLRELKLANNFISGIPNMKAGNLPYLCSIDLSNNVIGWTTEELGQQLQNNLGYLWRLTSISFLDNPFLQNVEEYHRLVKEFLPRLKHLDMQPIDQYSTIPMWQKIRMATKLMPNSPKKKDEENDTLWDKVMKMRKKEMTDEEKIAALIKKWQSPDPDSPSSTRSTSPRGATLQKGSKWADLRKHRRTTTPDGIKGTGMGKFAERLMVRRSSSSSVVTEKKAVGGDDTPAAGTSNDTQESHTRDDEKRRKLVEKLMIRRKESAPEFKYEPKNETEKQSAFLKRVLARRSSEPTPSASGTSGRDQASENKMRKKFIQRIKLRRRSSDGTVDASPDPDNIRWARKRKQSNAALSFAILRHGDAIGKAVDATEALKSVDDASSLADSTPPGSPFTGAQAGPSGTMVDSLHHRRPSTKVVSPQLANSDVQEEDLPDLALSVKEALPRKPSLAATAKAIKAASFVQSLSSSFQMATELGSSSGDGEKPSAEPQVNRSNVDKVVEAPMDGAEDK